MDSSELRIGNYTLDHGSPEQIPYGSDIDSASLMEPIALSEEWLVKFGFEVLKLVMFSKRKTGISLY
jgi:hypothetical protein